MEWNCSKCKRKIISEKKENFCLECGWKDLIEKTEINSETIRSFMEKNYFYYFRFNKEEYRDIIYIGIHKNFITSLHPPHSGYLDWEGTCHYPKSNRNIIRKSNRSEKYYDEYSAFLEKLFQFAEKEKIKRIRANYSIEFKTGGKLSKDIERKIIIFKVSNIIIEKKTAEELEKDKNIL